jgi:hypothetical protein
MVKNRGRIHAQTPEIYAQGGVRYTHRGHTSIGYGHLIVVIYYDNSPNTVIRLPN